MDFIISISGHIYWSSLFRCRLKCLFPSPANPQPAADTFTPAPFQWQLSRVQGAPAKIPASGAKLVRKCIYAHWHILENKLILSVAVPQRSALSRGWLLVIAWISDPLIVLNWTVFHLRTGIHWSWRLCSGSVLCLCSLGVTRDQWSWPDWQWWLPPIIWGLGPGKLSGR